MLQKSSFTSQDRATVSISKYFFNNLFYQSSRGSVGSLLAENR